LMDRFEGLFACLIRCPHGENLSRFEEWRTSAKGTKLSQTSESNYWSISAWEPESS
jgi:hypothetical protein